ncbi:unnamed protein product, partial [Adineta steineri]
KKADAILRQTFELAEYTIPRLFVILPEIKTSINPINWWTRSYRLFFICECDNERHFAFHEGYEMKQIRELFRKYGPYVQKMLIVVRAAIAVSSFVLPQLTYFSPSVQQTIPRFLLDKSFQDTLTNNLNSMDNVIEVSLKENLSTRTMNALHLEDNIQGVELREIRSFLKRTDNQSSFGNLYRSTNENGQIRWLCLHHYRQYSGEKQIEGLKQEFHQLGGEIRLDNAVVEKSSAKRLEEMLNVICRGLVLFKITLRNCKIRTSVFDKLLSIACQRNLIRHIKFQDIIIQPTVGFPKTHREIISKFEEALNNNKHLTIEYTVSLDEDTMKKDNSLLSHFVAHSTRRLSLNLYTSDIIERFLCSGLSDSDLQTIREWICKSKLSWSVRSSDRDRFVFAHSSQEMKQSLIILTSFLIQFQNLHELSYYKTTIEEDMLQTLCKALESNATSLRMLHFSEKPIANILTNNKISPIELSSSCVPHIVNMLKFNISLTELTLPSISCLHTDDIVSIIEALRIHPHICILQIGCIPPILRGDSYNVFDRLLNGTIIEDFTCVIDGDEQFFTLRDALEKNTILTSLRISILNMQCKEINEGFCQYIAQLPTLKILSLSLDVMIDCSRLCRSLVLSSSLQSLSLSRVSNWQNLTNLIESGWKLKSLSLCQCNIDFNDIELLVKSLRSNTTTITNLSLSNNNLSDDSVIKLGGALLSELFSLTMLDLSNNPLSLTCIVCLIKMLHFNTVLKVLDIRACLKRDDQECKKAIVDLTRMNEFVEVRWND